MLNLNLKFEFAFLRFHSLTKQTGWQKVY